MKVNSFARCGFLTAWLFPLVAVGEPAESLLDTVVVTGSRVEHDSFDLPASVDGVDLSRIRADHPRVNLSEALAAVPGVTVLNRQNHAQDLQISSRGFGARSAFGVRGVRLISDGIPATMPDGQGQVATFNLDQAERIEVLRGPMSSIYGNHAGGVIQLFTRDGKGAPRVDGGLFVGSDDTWKVDGNASGESRGLGYVLDASRLVGDGYRDHSAVERNQQFIKLTHAPDLSSRLTLLGNGFSQQAEDPLGVTWNRYSQNPRGVEPAAELYNTRKSIDHVQGGFRYERRFDAQSVVVSGYSGQRSVKQFQSIPWTLQQIAADAPESDPVRKHPGGVIAFDREFAGFLGNWSSRLPLFDGQLTTTVGLDYEYALDDRRGYANFSGTTLGVQGALRRQEEDRMVSVDPYAQLEWLGEQWGVSAGLRYSHVTFSVDDHYVTTGNGDDGGRVRYANLTPMAAVLYRWSPTFNLYVSAAKGFETPTLGELFYSGSDGSFSYTLEPAESIHLETGFKWWLGDHSRVNVALFQIRTERELVVDASAGGRTSYRNAGLTVRRGVEAAVTSQWGHGLATHLAMTQLEARYAEPFTARILGIPTVVEVGSRLPGVPERMVFGEVSWRHDPSAFHVALEGIARGKIEVEDSNRQQPAEAYAIANLRLGWEQAMGGWNWSEFVRVDNLADRRYIGSVVVGDGNGRFYEPAPGRGWSLGMQTGYAF
ncbi:MAG: TonB-dependent receptor [Magnetococcales bacterium]|nr:TonB-dependent receptor [Magnetococcales bacterium]